MLVEGDQAGGTSATVVGVVTIKSLGEKCVGRLLGLGSCCCRRWLVMAQSVGHAASSNSRSSAKQFPRFACERP